MGIKQLQDTIIREEGYILSDGTLNLNDLLSKAYDVFVRYEMDDEKLKKDIISVFTLKKEIGEYESLFVEKYYGDAEIKDDAMDDAYYIWNEDVFNFFNEIAPNGYSFGSSEGDGALIGWFKYDEEEDFYA